MAFVDAPVSGSSQPAADGQLVILASGAGPVRSRVEPVFDVLGRQTMWLEHAGEGSRLKLALNNWLAILVEGIAETITLSSALGLDPHLVVAAVAAGPLASPYATNKATAMLEADAAHDHHVDLALTDALLSRWERAIELGHGPEDVASAITVPAGTDKQR